MNNTIGKYLAATTLAAVIPSGACNPDSYRFPETPIRNVVPPEVGDRMNTLVRDAVTKCLDGTFSPRDFATSKAALGERTRYVNVVCKTASDKQRNAEILIGPEGVCTSSFVTANGDDFTQGGINCSVGY